MNIAKLMKQAQKVQGDVARAQEEVLKVEQSYTVGGGAVKATARGDNQLLDIKIDPALLNPAEAEALHDMLLDAVNGALKAVQKEANDKLSAATSGMHIPGLF